jgi:hypothetical protein
VLPKPDGSGRTIGTVLAGPALESIKAGKAFYGEVPILGAPYLTGYEPIEDSSGVQIGVQEVTGSLAFSFFRAFSSRLWRGVA